MNAVVVALETEAKLFPKEGVLRSKYSSKEFPDVLDSFPVTTLLNVFQDDKKACFSCILAPESVWLVPVIRCAQKDSPKERCNA